MSDLSKNWFVSYELGRGSFGKVSLCFPKEGGDFSTFRDKHQFCIKQLLRKESKSLTNELENIKKMFVINPEYSKKILPKIFDYTKGKKIVDHIVMEKLNMPSSIKIYAQLIDIVELLHLVGISHNDIKKNNILETVDGKPKLIDFGLSTPFGIFEKKHIGTIKYMGVHNHRGKIFHRNDYESIFYCVLNLFEKLPWSNFCQKKRLVYHMKLDFRLKILYDQNISAAVPIFKHWPALLEFGAHVFNNKTRLNVEYLKFLLRDIENYKHMVRSDQ